MVPLAELYNTNYSFPYTIFNLANTLFYRRHIFPLYFYIYLCMSLHRTISLSLSLSAAISFTLSLYLFLSLFLYLSLFVSLFVSLFLSLSLPLSLFISLFLSLSQSLSLAMSIFLYLYLSLSCLFSIFGSKRSINEGGAYFGTFKWLEISSKLQISIVLAFLIDIQSTRLPQEFIFLPVVKQEQLFGLQTRRFFATKFC